MVFLIFLANTAGYTMRANLSIAVVAMVKSNDTKPANDDFQQFDWDSTTKSTVLSSFFWG